MEQSHAQYSYISEVHNFMTSCACAIFAFNKQKNVTVSAATYQQMSSKRTAWSINIEYMNWVHRLEIPSCESWRPGSVAAVCTFPDHQHAWIYSNCDDNTLLLLHACASFSSREPYSLKRGQALGAWAQTQLPGGIWYRDTSQSPHLRHQAA